MITKDERVGLRNMREALEYRLAERENEAEAVRAAVRDALAITGERRFQLLAAIVEDTEYTQRLAGAAVAAIRARHEEEVAGLARERDAARAEVDRWQEIASTHATAEERTMGEWVTFRDAHDHDVTTLRARVDVLTGALAQIRAALADTKPDEVKP